MQRYSIALFLFFFSSVVLGQGIDFQNLSWDEALQTARNEGKPIFVDVYTDWCAPCKRMDQTTFKDSLLGSYFNDEFISIKANAEDNGSGTLIAKRYDVGSYPTLLFVSGNGELVTKFIGMHSKYELIRKGRASRDMYDNLDLLSSVKSNIHKSYTLQELEKILDISQLHTFQGKDILAMSYLDQIAEITEDDLRRVMGEVKNMDLDHLKRIVPLTTSISYYELQVRRDAKEWIKWRTDTEVSMYDYIEKATLSKDFETFRKAVEILKSSSGMKPKAVDKFYFDYYRRNDLTQYRSFAPYMIDEYIIPSRPEDVANADREKYKMLNEEVMNGLARLENSDVEVEYDSYEESKTPTIDSLSEIYTISKSIADELYQVSGDFFAFFDDESSRRKADFWASLSYKYYPYDLKYYDNHIYILRELGKTQEADQVEAKMKSLPLYHEMKQVKPSGL